MIGRSGPYAHPLPRFVGKAAEVKPKGSENRMMKFDLAFRFPDERAKSFDLINAALSELKLSDLSIKAQKGSLTVTAFRDESKPKAYNYVLEELALHCTQDAEAGSYRYQFDMVALPWEAYDPDRDYMGAWKQQHPELELCFLQTVTYDAAKATVYNVLYRVKAD